MFVEVRDNLLGDFNWSAPTSTYAMWLAISVIPFCAFLFQNLSKGLYWCMNCLLVQSLWINSISV